MTSKDSHQRLGDKSIEAVFKCGHKATVYYNGEKTKFERLTQAERNLCPECKKKKLKKENEHIWVPYGYYKEHLKHARNIITGEYDKETGKIEVYLPQNKHNEYTEWRNRIYYEPHNTPVQSNRSTFTICVKGKNTKDIKENLKALGAKWYGKRSFWYFVIDVEVDIDQNGNKEIRPEKNQQYYNLITSLEKLGCIADFSYIEW